MAELLIVALVVLEVKADVLGRAFAMDIAGRSVPPDLAVRSISGACFIAFRCLVRPFDIRPEGCRSRSSDGSSTVASAARVRSRPPVKRATRRLAIEPAHPAGSRSDRVEPPAATHRERGPRHIAGVAMPWNASLTPCASLQVSRR